MSVPTIPLGRLYAEPARNGLTRPTSVRGDGFKMVNMGELFAYDRIGGQEMERVPLSPAEIERTRLEAGDLLFARSSLTPEGTGKVSIVIDVPEVTTFESHIIRVRLNREMADPLFYYYYFGTHYGRGLVLSLANQVGASGLAGSKLAGLNVPWPDKALQIRIGRTVGQFDELIEANTRRIALLERAARLLYEEWFVWLRFPGRDRISVVDGLPQEWKRTTFAGVCDSIGGGTPSTEEPTYWDDGEIPWVTPTDITACSCLSLLDTERHITDAGLRASSATMLPSNAVLMTSRASIGFLAVADRPVCTNQGFISIVPHRNHLRYYLLYNLLSRRRELEAHSSGSTFMELSRSRFRQLPVIEPSEILLDRFHEACTPLLSQVRTLALQNRELRKARDLLLPRLMSGAVAV